MRHAEAVDYLYSLGNEVLTAKLGLHNMEVLLRFLGEPHKKFRSILIAGTNGKGSVAAFCDSILRASGYRTGMYTSPHLIQIEERIRIDGKMIGSDEFARLTGEVKDAVGSLMKNPSKANGGQLERHPTYFEMVTAVAFKYFAEQQIEIAVLEVGLGGRLDATNVVDPLAAVITNVELDHQQYLGGSIAEIAVEKAGVIKSPSQQRAEFHANNRLSVVFSGHDGPALEVIKERCRTVKAELFRPPEHIKYEAKPDSLGRFRVRLDCRLGSGIKFRLPLAGEHQVLNALTAIQVMELIADRGYRIGSSNIALGLSQTDWPGRLEILDSQPRIVLDGAHNPDAAEKIRRYLENFLQPRQIVMVFGAMRDKAIEEMARKLFPSIKKIILTRVEYERSATPLEILNLLPEYEDSARMTGSVREALIMAKELASDEDTIVIVGSLFLIGEVKMVLQHCFTSGGPIASARAEDG
jgi:dihydrofolate synthase / folylpolyglutamate synthase